MFSQAIPDQKWPHHFLLTISHLIEEKEKITSQSDTFGSHDYRLIQFRSRLFTFLPSFLPSFLSPQSRANQLSLKEDPSISSFFPPSANQETNYYSKETFVFAGPLLPLLPPLRFLQLIDTLTTIKFSVFSARRGIPEKKVNRYGSRGEGEPRLWGKRHWNNNDYDDLWRATRGPRSLPDMVSIVASLLSTLPHLPHLRALFFFLSSLLWRRHDTWENSCWSITPARGARKRAAKKSGSACLVP